MTLPKVAKKEYLPTIIKNKYGGKHEIPFYNLVVLRLYSIMHRYQPAWLCLFITGSFPFCYWPVDDYYLWHLLLIRKTCSIH